MATHIAGTSLWTLTKQGITSPAGNSYLLSDFDAERDAIGIIYDTRQRTRVLRLIITDGAASAGPALDRPHGRPAHEPADLGTLPLLPHKLPPSIIHGAVLADLRISELLRFYDMHTQENIAGMTVNPGWMEHPPEPVNQADSDQAIAVAVRLADMPADNEPRTFSLDGRSFAFVNSSTSARKALPNGNA